MIVSNKDKFEITLHKDEVKEAILTYIKSQKPELGKFEITNAKMHGYLLDDIELSCLSVDERQKTKVDISA